MSKPVVQFLGALALFKSTHETFSLLTCMTSNVLCLLSSVCITNKSCTFQNCFLTIWSCVKSILIKICRIFNPQISLYIFTKLNIYFYYVIYDAYLGFFLAFKAIVLRTICFYNYAQPFFLCKFLFFIGGGVGSRFV